VKARSRESLLETVAQLDRLLEALDITVREAEAKAKDFARTPPTAFDLRGLGSLVHDFYTAIEDVFELIAGDINGSLPETLQWHKQLLNRMTLEVPEVRPPVISKGLARTLDEYLRFRHVFRNVYGYMLDWERLRPLLNRIPAVYNRFREEISAFRRFLLGLAHKLGAE
jgi:3'-phosphoadenosine 5'-phosphosulfate sulfotransferase (PAPS reductase)/FAD synthetase